MLECLRKGQDYWRDPAASSDSQGRPARGLGAVYEDAYGFPLNGGMISPFGDTPTPLAISDDGRYVVFASSALNPGGIAVLFRKDMQTGELSAVSQFPSEGPAKATFYEAAMSGDGRFIVFWTRSPADIRAGKYADLYIRDMESANPELVSTAALTNLLPSGSLAPNPVAISADGRYIVFAAGSSSPIGGPYPAPGVFVKDRQTGELRTISAGSGGEQANGSAQGASISADGRFAVFASSATNLVSEQTCLGVSGDCSNVFLKDLESGGTMLLSKTETGAAMNNAGSPVISQDGRSVAFVTLMVSAVDIENHTRPLPAPSVEETIYLFDLVSGRLRPEVEASGDLAFRAEKDQYRVVMTYGPFGAGVQVSEGMAGGQGISISADGRFLAFPAIPSWIGEKDRKCEHSFTREIGLKTTFSAPCIDIFVKDSSTGELSRVSAPDD